jgi:hypothetical protein
MKHLKKFESLYELPVILDLKDMSLDLTDSGWNIEIFKDETQTSDNVRVRITNNFIRFKGSTRKGNFTMTNELKDFLFRMIGYMKDNGYEFTTHSNFGRLHFIDDGRVIISSGEARPNYPTFTMIDILFKKS